MAAWLLSLQSSSHLGKGTIKCLISAGSSELQLLQDHLQGDLLGLLTG